jgi:CRP-like cAMP-binding protein
MLISDRFAWHSTDEETVPPDRRRTDDGFDNGILSALPRESAERLAVNLETIDLSQGATIGHADEPIDYVYFVHRGLVSLVKTLEDGQSIEVRTVGIEGMTGLPVLLSSEHAFTDYIVEVPGFASRIVPRLLRDEVKRDRALAGLLQQYAHAAFAQFVHMAACNGLHSVRERCCRWLLVAHDNAGSDGFPLTHETLAALLGVQRAGVSNVAHSLRHAGLIDYRHGSVTIENRSGLEREACGCYRILRAQFRHLASGVEH